MTKPKQPTRAKAEAAKQAEEAAKQAAEQAAAEEAKAEAETELSSSTFVRLSTCKLLCGGGGNPRLLDGFEFPALAHARSGAQKAHHFSGCDQVRMLG